MSTNKSAFNISNIGKFVLNNIVTILFIAFTIVGFIYSTGVSFDWFLTELGNRFYRNAFLVLSLIIPVIAGLGLNFGIIVGAMSGQLALVLVRYFHIQGIGGFFLTALIGTPIAAFFGYLTGLLYNKTRGQETIASLIVGYFGSGIYLFILLFVVGYIIPVDITNPVIKPDGVGVRVTVDMGTMQYALEKVAEVPFMYAILAVALIFLTYYIIRSVAITDRTAFDIKTIHRTTVYCDDVACVVTISV
jgi:simple sugar transport system permease protein